jgi:hypothetical protein
MNDPEKLATMGTQKTRQRQTNQKTQRDMCWISLYKSFIKVCRINLCQFLK